MSNYKHAKSKKSQKSGGYVKTTISSFKILVSLQALVFYKY